MLFKSIATTTLALSLIAATSIASAQNNDNNNPLNLLPCPSISALQASLNGFDYIISANNGTFTVGTTQPIFTDNLGNAWYVGVNNVAANNILSALDGAYAKINALSNNNNVDAIQLNSIQVCTYGNGDVAAVTGDINAGNIHNALRTAFHQ